ncbi:uncharacterized protein RHO25_004964 [Cercospora beticola]|uniref:Uncharacterized protein n=1 Tax=Cercospora beticola TaxID=122368 RepID=A0ABZ0NLJ5_CERBT|nr:hypothetical protein RHO25_004964 [Cercospora beticola]CAK1361450.1 unnamed protein product [Cercospora beticola]
MCKTQTWQYLCGCFSDHRLSTCRGSYTLNGHASCLGRSYLPSILAPILCASCLKIGVLRTLDRSRSKEVNEARDKGERINPIYRHYAKLRAQVYEAMPLHSLTVRRPRPESTWTPHRPSPLQKELKRRDLYDQYMEGWGFDDTIRGSGCESGSDTDLEWLEFMDSSMAPAEENRGSSSEEDQMDISETTESMEGIEEYPQCIDPALLALDRAPER